MKYEGDETVCCRCKRILTEQQDYIGLKKKTCFYPLFEIAGIQFVFLHLL